MQCPALLMLVLGNWELKTRWLSPTRSSNPRRRTSLEVSQLCTFQKPSSLHPHNQEVQILTRVTVGSALGVLRLDVLSGLPPRWHFQDQVPSPELFLNLLTFTLTPSDQVTPRRECPILPPASDGVQAEISETNKISLSCYTLSQCHQ